MFSSAYTSTSTKSPTIEDWAKKVDQLEDRVEPAITDMRARLGMGITPIVLKNREYELVNEGITMQETYDDLAAATKGLKQLSSMKVIPYISPLIPELNKEDEEENKKSTKMRQMVSKPSANDFLEGGEE
jgi:hypothetical protein